MHENPKHLVSLIVAMNVYLEDCELEEQSPRTIEGKMSSLRHFIRWHIVEYGTKLLDLSKASINDYKLYLKTYTGPNRHEVICDATRRNKVTHVLTFVTRLFELGYLEADHGKGVKRPKTNRKLTTGILQTEEIEAIRRHTAFYGIKGRRDEALLEILFASGIRRNEAASLDLKSLIVRDEESMLYVKDRKCLNDRYVPISQETFDLVMRYIKEIRPLLSKIDSGKALILGDDGERIKDKKVSAIVRKYKLRAGISKAGAANLYRHTTATTMLENGAGLMFVQKMLGHKSVVTTQTYVHIAMAHMCSEYKRTHPAAQEKPPSK